MRGGSQILIGVGSLILAAMACLVTVAVPEIRCFIGLDPCQTRIPTEALPQVTVESMKPVSVPATAISAMPEATSTPWPTESPSPTITPAPKEMFSYVILKQYSELAEEEIDNLGLRSGQQSIDGLPFSIGWKASTRCSSLPNQPTSFPFDVNIPRPQNLYLLLQAGWGMREYSGNQIGFVALNFSDGSNYVVPLILGKNIRDWSVNNTQAVNTLSSSETQEAIQGNAPDGQRGRIDLMSIEIPEDKRPLTLNSIIVSDTSQEINPCIHLVAITIRHLS